MERNNDAEAGEGKSHRNRKKCAVNGQSFSQRAAVVVVGVGAVAVGIVGFGIICCTFRLGANAFCECASALNGLLYLYSLCTIVYARASMHIQFNCIAKKQKERKKKKLETK